VLDLFAGTGAIGFEALSRGAARVQFVDDGTESRALLRQNIDAFDVIGQTKIYRRDATRLGENRGPGFDYLFLDPPYHTDLGDRAMRIRPPPQKSASHRLMKGAMASAN